LICKLCRDKSVARGIKFINCFRCGKKEAVNYLYQNYCEDCSNELQKCQRCGEKITTEISREEGIDC